MEMSKNVPDWLSDRTVQLSHVRFPLDAPAAPPPGGFPAAPGATPRGVKNCVLRHT